MPEKPRGLFLILEGREVGKSVSIGQLPFTIGRLPGNSLSLADNQVSREHARVEVGPDGTMKIVDLRSRNGLFVNAKRVAQAPLVSGDKLRIGSTVLIFELDASSVKKTASLAGLEPLSADDLNPESNEGRPLSAEEPTSIRNIVDLESAVVVDSSQSLNEVIKLFRSTLPPQGIVPQLLDIFFQSFAPDRAKMIWEVEEKVEAARSRQQGKKCPLFPIDTTITSRGLAGATMLKSPEQHSILIAPLRAYGEVKGWVYGERPLNVKPYSTQEITRLEAFASVTGAVLERSTILLDQRKLREQILLMEKHLSPEISRMLASRQVNIEESMLSVEEKEVSILFSDIQGFTGLSERLSAPEVAALLNEYFQRMVDVVSVNHGMINKFIGDAVMALFGAPKSCGNDAANAVSAALAMIDALKLFWKQIDERKRFNIRIGVNTGVVVAGNIGSEKKMEYTVLGDEVNLASRFESISPANVVTIGPRTAELLQGQFRLEKVSGVKVKGKSELLEVFRVLGVA